MKRNKIVVLAVVLFAVVVLASGYGAFSLMSVVPEPTYEQVSSVSDVNPNYKMVFIECYTGTSGKYHCYYRFYDNGVSKMDFYTTDSNPWYYGDLKLVRLGGRGYASYIKVVCSKPNVNIGDVVISETGLAKVEVNLYSGKTTQKIDLSKVDVLAYNGINWINLNSQLDPTGLINQTPTFKWQMIAGETGFLKIKMVNSCGYELDYIESDKVTYSTTGTIIINSTPNGTVRFNNVEIGTTPATLTGIERGIYGFTIDSDGYDTFSGQITVLPMKVVQIDQSLSETVMEPPIIIDEPEKLTIWGFIESILDWLRGLI